MKIEEYWSICYKISEGVSPTPKNWSFLWIFFAKCVVYNDLILFWITLIHLINTITNHIVWIQKKSKRFAISKQVCNVPTSIYCLIIRKRQKGQTGKGKINPGTKGKRRSAECVHRGRGYFSFPFFQNILHFLVCANGKLCIGSSSNKMNTKPFTRGA